MSITLQDVEAAAKAIAGSVIETACLHLRTLSEITRAQIYLKFENHQFTAAFKERGALNKLLSLTAEQRARGVIAASGGNHAQGVAYHARRLGIPAVIVMPRYTPGVKVRHTRATAQPCPYRYFCHPARRPDHTGIRSRWNPGHGQDPDPGTSQGDQRLPRPEQYLSSLSASRR